VGAPIESRRKARSSAVLEARLDEVDLAVELAYYKPNHCIANSGLRLGVTMQLTVMPLSWYTCNST